LYFFKAAGEISGAKDIVLAEANANITQVLGHIGEEILAISHGLKSKEIKYFEAKDNRQLIAVGSIQVLDWYITAVRPFTIADSLNTGMTVFFGVIMAVIFLIFIVFNIFIIGMLEPLNRMVKTIIQTLSDLDLRPQTNEHYDEIETLGEFFHLTIIDQLTGIYNRRYMDGNLKKIIKFHSRTGSSLSVLMIDIDYFKKYNDTYGHDAGDVCLRAVASALSQCVIREGDFVARYGGEEFAAVLPNTDKDGADVVALKMLEKVRELNIPHETSGIEDYVTVSIGGTACIVNHLQHGSDYIKSADKALYESKKNGRNRYTFLNFS
jgi:diguanylate cyclase (GGDEF)-like protein